MFKIAAGRKLNNSRRQLLLALRVVSRLRNQWPTVTVRGQAGPISRRRLPVHLPAKRSSIPFTGRFTTPVSSAAGPKSC